MTTELAALRLVATAAGELLRHGPALFESGSGDVSCVYCGEWVTEPFNAPHADYCPWRHLQIAQRELEKHYGLEAAE